MIWLELRANNAVYDKGWNFSESVWAPTKKNDGTEWPFWNLISKVTKGDLIFHIRELNGNKYFVGYSIAATDGYKTKHTSTANHVWSFTNEFYKVDLCDYEELNPNISLNKYFNDYNEQLRNYFLKNKKLPQSIKKRLFYVIQNKRLQCLNGAYFSEFDFELSSYLKNNLFEIRQKIKSSVETDVFVGQINQRIGHQQFSENVKANFNYKCCFPDCNVEGKGFLISGHISRWADNENFRGETSNGLCLCLFHDKAFENGYFTLDEEYNIILLNHKYEHIKWLNNFLEKGKNKRIKSSEINPSFIAIKEHWKRVNYYPII
jgi:putative restriction endonuclease